MAETVAIGIQNFDKLREGNYFYIDKTSFIREWWENGDDVTLITRPRRFGKTLNMSMLEFFFSTNYEGRGDLFEGLSIWQDEKYRAIQGTYPVFFLSFARIKEKTYEKTKEKICEVLRNLYIQYSFIKDGEYMTVADKRFFDSVLEEDMRETVATSALYQLSDYLYRYYGKKVIILLDEYDTPMQEAYVNGFWDELVCFTRNLFNSSFKTNPFMERAVMTGITRVSKESIFSDLNNPEVVTTTSDKYATSFGFTEKEVFEALEQYGYGDKKGEVKKWYDGFTFGMQKDMYNPWSILNFLDKGKFASYWANTSGNGLVSKLLQEGNAEIKIQFELLLQGEKLHKIIDEQVVYNQLDDNEEVIWSLLVASGYLKVDNVTIYGETECDLSLTNLETRMMFEKMIGGWFHKQKYNYNAFIEALLLGDLDYMNEYMNEITINCFSSFDAGNRPSGKKEPERFYHGFVLGLLVDLQDRYYLRSNRQSGLGRYDIMLEPKDIATGLPGFIIEFKVFQTRKEKSLEETLQAALRQIEEKQYDQELISRGVPRDNIRKYGFVFEGQKVLIG